MDQETITAVFPVGTASGLMHHREEFAGMRPADDRGGLFIVFRDGYRIAEIEHMAEGWKLRIGDATDMNVGLKTVGTCKTRHAAAFELARHELRARPSHVTITRD